MAHCGFLFDRTTSLCSAPRHRAEDPHSGDWRQSAVAKRVRSGCSGEYFRRRDFRRLERIWFALHNLVVKRSGRWAVRRRHRRKTAEECRAESACFPALQKHSERTIAPSSSLEKIEDKRVTVIRKPQEACECTGMVGEVDTRLPPDTAEPFSGLRNTTQTCRSRSIPASPSRASFRQTPSSPMLLLQRNLTAVSRNCRSWTR